MRTIRDRYYALRYRLFGRCWARGCGRLMVLHGPWRLARCWADNVPLAVLIECVADHMAEREPVVPVSHAKPA